MRERYVLLGLAPPRAEWYRRVGHWAAGAMLPGEFIRCVSAEELQTRLEAARPYSAVLVDAGLPALDRDLVEAAHARDAAVLVMRDASGQVPRSAGVDAVLPADCTRQQLLEALQAHARMVGDAASDASEPDDDPRAPRPAGRLIAVTGTGGTGASTAAIALAQGLAGGAGRASGTESGASASSVLLIDGCRAADQAMLHDARTLVPGLQEVVEAHRGPTPSVARLREQTFEVPERGYRLLLGLRRPRHWALLRPRALEAALDATRRLADEVVVDVDPDVEGEAWTGSVDVEERHLITRTVLDRAEVVVVVGEPSAKGAFALARLLGELLDHGVPAARLLPAISQAPRSPRRRAELTRAVGRLLEAVAGDEGTAMPACVHLPARRVDAALRDGVALPRPLPDALARAVAAVADRAGADEDRGAQPLPERVAPGSLGVLDDVEVER